MDAGNQVKMCNMLLKRSSEYLAFHDRHRARKQLTLLMKSLKGTHASNGQPREAASPPKRQRDAVPSNDQGPQFDRAPPAPLAGDFQASAPESASSETTNALLTDLRELLLDGRVDEAIDHAMNDSLWVRELERCSSRSLLLISAPVVPPIEALSHSKNVFVFSSRDRPRPIPR